MSSPSVQGGSGSAAQRNEVPGPPAAGAISAHPDGRHPRPADRQVIRPMVREAKDNASIR